MLHYKLILKHPIMGFVMFQAGEFTENAARMVALKHYGTGYKLISSEKLGK